MKIVIEEGSIIPHYPWYLPAYDEFRLNTDKACVICYPIGINIIVKLFRRFVHWSHWRLRYLTLYDELDYANSRIETLTRENMKLRTHLEILTMNKELHK